MEADLKTLRLASPALSSAALEGYLRYQRSLLALRGSLALEEAHRRSLQASGLDVLDLEALRAVCADFCGRRRTVKELRERRAKAQASGKSVQVERIDEELPRLEDLSGLEKRYGGPAVALLRSNEDELLSLHEQLAAAG